MKNKKIIDPEDIFSKMISDEIDKIILNTLLFDNFSSNIIAKNREEKINSILDDTDANIINIEDTEEYKILSEENKEKYKKYGRLF